MCGARAKQLTEESIMTRPSWAAAGTAAVVLLLAVGAMRATGGDALSSLVAAERAFAKMSVDSSQRDAFLANFADDGVWFVPAPSNTKLDLRKQAPSPAAAGRMLDWDPLTGDVSASGDLGYTTGPWIRSERTERAARGKTLGTGWFLSVWRRAADGSWKVAADFGVESAHKRVLRSEAFRRADAHAAAPRSNVDAKTLADELRAADLQFGRQVSASGWADALRTSATDDVRIYRDGHEPAPGRASASAVLPAGPRPSAWAPSVALASAAGDLGYTYGARSEQVGGRAIRGYYLHVWKRVAGGWRLAADVANVEQPAGRQP
jgi:ketosteroid isomerase-like protein